MLSRYAILPVIALAFTGTHAQNLQLPTEWHFSPDGHRLMIGGEPVEGFYEKETIREMHLQFDQPDWWDQLVANEATNDRIPVTVIMDGIQYDSVAIRFKGSAPEEVDTTLKRSFNMDFNRIIDGQDIMGYSTVKLDNASNDPSFLREVIYSEIIRNYIPTAKANFIHLFINGEDWGLYPNIQHMNSPYLREWFFSNNGSLWRAESPIGLNDTVWGDGVAALNWLGADTTSYQQYYTLERTEQIQPWDALVKVIDKLNNTPFAQLEDSLNRYMNVDRALWFLACENLFGDRDSYIRKGKNDYMVYYAPESGRFSMLELDGRSTMRTSSFDWSPFYHADDSNYPLLYRLLSVPSLRQRYLAHMRTIIEEQMQSADFNALVDDHAALIDAQVQSDPKKLYTHIEFLNEVIALKEFVNARRLVVQQNFEITQEGPEISAVQHSVGGEAWAQPLIGESVDVRANVSSSEGISNVVLHYSPGVTGRFIPITMFDDGAHNDGGAGDGIYGATIPPAPPVTQVRYYIAAHSGNAANTVTYEPAGAEHDVYTYQVQHPTEPDPAVRINEVMALNLSTAADAFLEYDDWIELYNNSDQPVDLSGLWISDNGQILQKWQFPIGTVLQPFAYKILWADGQPEQGDDHLNFALSADGESVWLSSGSGVVIDHVLFGPQEGDLAYARRPNGFGPFEFQAATFGTDNDLVSVPEIGGASLLRIHPNPASDRLVIASDEPLHIVIHDALLRQVYSGTIKGSTAIDVSHLPAGTYFIRHKGGVQKAIIIR